VKVEISNNELIDRLRVVQSRLTEQNEHSDALFIGFAIQALELKQQTEFKPYPCDAAGLVRFVT